ncbi:MAG: DUF4124 domain-containing protein [Halofilum sp. (in: g-proteobacteria)]
MAETDTLAMRVGTRALVVLALLWMPVAGAGELHRWVDQDGKTHYTDAPPPDSARGAASDADREKEEATPSAREEAAAADRAERSRRDQILRQSYSSIADVERTRDRRLEGVDSEINLAEHRVAQVRQRIERYDRLLPDLPDDNQHRAEMKEQRAEARERLERRREDLERVRGKRVRMEARFAEDIRRFRELMADRE